MSFFVDPFGLLLFGAILYIVSTNYNIAKSLMSIVFVGLFALFVFWMLN
jgi:hypothetical protein